MTEIVESKPFTIRTVKAVKNLEWADVNHTVLRAEVLFEELEDQFGFVNFSTIERADTDHGIEVWSKAIAGEYGVIGEYDPPPPQPEPIPDNISRRQFFQYLAVLEIITRQEALAALQSGAIPAPLQAIIDELPSEDDRFEAQMFIIGAQNFNRLHWLTDRVRLAMQWTLEQRDYFWRSAANL
ncbi:hypothetical protein EDF68_104153 [Ochrobactrum sp. BH3]|nr:hypothetical protein EDF68_104153 [Ochrobactrum sp. BH3]